ncbi:MAG: helix-turn-helix domain-containing protein [Hyphomicrobium sp.]|nr:helix-turn-helix domain-containing protein [Hyphomicrobium sp.]
MRQELGGNASGRRVSAAPGQRTPQQHRGGDQRRGAPAKSPLQSARRAIPARDDAPDTVALEQMCTLISRYFIDLRAVVRVTPQQIAAHLVIDVAVIETLEAGYVEYLPAWPETARIVMAYTGLAGIDGRAILEAIGDAMKQAAALATYEAAHAAVTVAPSPHRNPTMMSRAGTAVAQRASGVRAAAVDSVSSRPTRMVLAIVVPCAMLVAGYNTSAVGQALRPVHRVASDVGDFFRVHFAPVREGHRWIDVRDPRSRRGDKLQIKGG